MVQNNRCGNGVGSTKEKKQKGKGANGKHATNKKVGEREERVRCGGIDLLHNFFHCGLVSSSMFLPIV